MTRIAQREGPPGPPCRAPASPVGRRLQHRGQGDGFGSTRPRVRSIHRFGDRSEGVWAAGAVPARGRGEVMAALLTEVEGGNGRSIAMGVGKCFGCLARWRPSALVVPGRRVGVGAPAGDAGNFSWRIRVVGRSGCGPMPQLASSDAADNGCGRVVTRIAGPDLLASPLSGPNSLPANLIGAAIHGLRARSTPQIRSRFPDAMIARTELPS
jgi:hypothetical protein